MVVFLLLLTGCNPTAGATRYEIIYPSGYTMDYRNLDKKIPVEGTSYYLQFEEIRVAENTYRYDLKVQDECDSVLYECFDIGYVKLRGSLQKDDIIWICEERWKASGAYVEGWLEESDLFLINLEDGEMLFRDKVGENVFYITSKETRCYFYEPGKEENEWLFGIIKMPPQNAEIYYRDTSDWTQKHTVYTFDYVVEPDIDTSKGVETRIRFYISEDQLKAAWTSYEAIGNGNWEYLEKRVYDIPLDVNNF